MRLLRHLTLTALKGTAIGQRCGTTLATAVQVPSGLVNLVVEHQGVRPYSGSKPPNANRVMGIHSLVASRGRSDPCVILHVVMARSAQS